MPNRTDPPRSSSVPPMTTIEVAPLLDRARAWAAEDPDDRTRAELERLIDAVAGGADATELADRFDGTLEFGTAGLRGALGAGSNRMNRVVVTRAAAGLAAYLKDNGATRESSVVIGYDARHNSDVFARDTAEVITVAGLAADGPRDLEIVYTPLHGVGGTSVAQVLETAGFDAPRIVAQQEQPDPDFPTVSFPNPEEPGAMDLAMALAGTSGADLVVANDPDADRCAAAVPGP